VAAGKYDIVIEQGATFSYAITWKNSAGSKILMRDTTNAYTVRMKIKDAPGGTEIDSFIGTYNGDNTNWPSDSAIWLFGDSSNTDPTHNIQVVINATTTDGYDFDNGVYDVEAENSTGDVQRIIEGRVKLKHSVTK